jgi:hypothetical protein
MAIGNRDLLLLLLRERLGKYLVRSHLMDVDKVICASFGPLAGYTRTQRMQRTIRNHFADLMWLRTGKCLDCSFILITTRLLDISLCLLSGPSPATTH